MRVFAIKDETLPADRILGYLIYYQQARAFYIELPENGDPWETPLLLDGFLKRGETGVGSYWSRMWVQQRIVPPDRQNIGQILRENGLTEYDEFSLLLLSQGRCAQDDCYLEEISAKELPKELEAGWRKKVEDVVPPEGRRLLVFFRDGAVKVVGMDTFTDRVPDVRPFVEDEGRFARVEVQPGGHGICSALRRRHRCSAAPVRTSMILRNAANCIRSARTRGRHYS